jgi:hypothetical protein
MGVAWYESAWTIAAATIVLTYLATPVLDAVVGWLRSRRGKLTGTYVALTNQGGVLVVERVTCRQVGDALDARIDGVLTATPTDGQVTTFEPISGTRYRLSGKRVGDVVVMAYWAEPKSTEAGTITLRVLPSREQILLGAWAGALEFEVVHAPCMWVRVNRDDFPSGEVEAFVEGLNCALLVLADPLRLLGFRDDAVVGPPRIMLKGAEPDYTARISQVLTARRK